MSESKEADADVGEVETWHQLPREIIARIEASSRVDLSAAPTGALAWLLCRCWMRSAQRRVVITSDNDSAQRLAASLRFFLPISTQAESPVLEFPAPDTSPFLPVAADRRATMDRMQVLSTLADAGAWSFIVAPVAAVLTRSPPLSAVQNRCALLHQGEEHDPSDVMRALVDSGYLRTPVAEDAGTFAARGAILDIYPAGAGQAPVRLEFDDWLVRRIQHYDPDTQRSTSEAASASFTPARALLWGDAEVSLASRALRALCDRFDYPTVQATALVDDLTSGRSFPGADAFLPALYPKLSCLWDYTGADTPYVIHEPDQVGKAASRWRHDASIDRQSRVAEGGPAYETDELVASLDEFAVALEQRSSLWNHGLAIVGDANPAPDGETPEAVWQRLVAPASEMLSLGAQDQTEARTAIRGRRKTAGAEGALLPLAEACEAWLEDGLRAFVASRSRTQADRIVSLLSAYDLPLRRPADFRAKLLEEAAPRKLEVVVGALSEGFVLPTAGLAFITESEIFGERRQRRARRKASTKSANAFLEDLRELTLGDYVVHREHGIGCYQGIERKVLGVSRQEELHGREPPSLEVLIIAYQSGDKLFLPVTRLNQIQKFSSKEGQAPKLDKLGGQTFARTKARVRKRVRDIADQLLKLYAERANASREALPTPGAEYEEFEATFPYEETRDQRRAIDDVLSDLESGVPMDRLVCGDVGFGKTEVALRAAFRAAMSGRQVAILCPTTVLCHQHFQTFRNRLADYPLRVESLSRFVDRKAQKRNLSDLKAGTIDIIVGTHRLLSKDVHFDRLGLLVVDEEQRFGVTHKERIKELRKDVDVLTLSATPIPRTLQMAVGGLRDLSLITTPPVDRRAVRTFVCRWDDHLIREAIRRELRRGGQAFFVYNRIEGLYERAARLQELVPEARIAVAHGQLNERLLETLMVDFVAGEYDILCSTAIIESGLDIPRANTMLIDRADIFGLSQLYQLRGRVGRSRERAYCYLITPADNRLSDDARFRLQALERFTELGSGFQIASLDMELRGAGDILGAEQSGAVSAVGLEIFSQMLQEAVAQLEGRPAAHAIDPELSLEGDLHIPESYVDDVGLRLSLYKRLASAEDDDVIDELAAEMEERFGPAPSAARAFVAAMRLRPRLRTLHVLGCEASKQRVTLHLRQDTPLDPRMVMGLVANGSGLWKLTPDMKLTRRFKDTGPNPTARVVEVLDELMKVSKS